MSNLIFQVYKNTRSSYLKLRSRLNKNIANGRFHQFTRKKQNQILQKIERLRKRLLQLQFQLKIAAAGSTLSLLLNTTPMQAQTTLGPFVRNYIDNPLPPPLPYIQRPAPVYVDLDGDSDLDLVVGENYSSLLYFENIGSANSPFFVDRTNDPSYPFNNVEITIPFTNRSLVPAFADVDGDGDMDLLVGTDDNKYGGGGETFYFKNQGTATAPDFVNETGPFVPDLVNPGNSTGNPFNSIASQRFAHPTFADLDNDGDTDLVLAGYYDASTYDYLIQYFENTGTTTNPSYVANTSHSLVQRGVANHLFYAQQRDDSPAAFADLDGDNDLDFIVGSDSSVFDRLRYFINNGDGTVGDPVNPLTFTEQFGPWNPVTKQGNPFISIGYFRIGYYGARPFFVDFDNDGDQDILMGNRYSDLDYFVNDGNSNFTPAIFPNSSNELVLSGFFSYNAPHLADIDLDGQLDLLLGNSGGELRFFKGSGISFTEQTGTWDPVAKTGNPFDLIFTNRYTVPALADLDGDGDLDMVLGNQRKYPYSYGYSYNDPLRYFLNDPADGETAVFKELTGLNNPFDGVDVGRNAAPAFVQLDAGAEMDALLGSKYQSSSFNEYDNRLRFFKNTSGSFEEKTGSDNPFNSILPLLNTYFPYTPHFVNLDADADLELVMKDYFYDLRVFDKSGDDYVELSEGANPFTPINALITSFRASLAFGDIDNDGDTDLFVGEDNGYNGVIRYFENKGLGATPMFEEKTGVENPLAVVQHPYYMPLPVLIDIDNDGDLDALVPRTSVEEPVETFFFENTGTPSVPVFTQLLNHPFENLPISNYAQRAFIDWDNDGDLDLFSGEINGTVMFFLNGNPAPLTSFSLGQTTFNFGAGPVTLDANLTLADSDGDLVVEARVAIQNFEAGKEVLTFTPQGNITGLFDTATGVLTLSGQATVAVYQTVLRSVRYEFVGAKPAAGGKDAGKPAAGGKAGNRLVGSS